MKDGDLREARRCLANEETGKAIELYEAMRKCGEHEAEADLAVKICKYYDACKSGAQYDIKASEAELFLRIKSMDAADTEFALAFPQLVAKALTLQTGPGGCPVWRKFFTRKFWSDDHGELQQLPNGLEADDWTFYEPDGLDAQGHKLYKVIANRVRVRFEIAEISRNIFLGALASDEFAMLDGDAKRRLELAAAELDGYYVFYNRGSSVPQYDEQMNDIYRRLGLLNARTKKVISIIMLCLTVFVIVPLCFILFMECCAYIFKF